MRARSAVRRAVFLCAILTACRSPAVGPLDIHVNRDTRLLVVAPHPDDEAIAAAGLIRRTTRLGGRVKVVLVTSGDGFAEGVETGERLAQPTSAAFRGYGKTREHESVTAMAGLGVPAADVTFLGFPDQGLCLLASGYLSSHGHAFESPFTDRTSPPADERIVRGIKYRGGDVEREMREIISDFTPTIIVMPHPEDDHPDHCASYIFASAALQTLNVQRTLRPRLLYYLVHDDQWPLELGMALGPELKPPSGFPSSEGQWKSLTLTAEEASAKKEALAAYRTQMEIIGRFLRSFARDNELFLDHQPAPPECWCDAEHVATDVPASKRRRTAGR